MKLHLRPNNVQAVAACIEQLSQPHKASHLFSASAADDGGRHQPCDLSDRSPHLHKEASVPQSLNVWILLGEVIMG